MDYYEILGISEKSKSEEVRKAYHKMAFKYHPDKCSDEDAEEKFKRVVEAYEILSDPIKRRRYDLSRKLQDDYDFQLPPEILRFSRYFFSDKNMRKFQNVGNIISQQAEIFGININFEIMLHSFLNNIRNGKYYGLLEEYQMFRKFYEFENEAPKGHFFKQNKKKQEEEYEYRKKNKQTEMEKEESRGSPKKCNSKTSIVNTVSNLKNTKFNNKCVNVNVSVNLENVYNRNIKVANIDIDKRCPKCEGSGVIFVDNGVKKCKNSKSKYRRKNLSRKKNDSYLDKKICSKCKGLTKIQVPQKFLIDTSLDKICYLNQYFVSEEDDYYDIIFNINIKKHGLYYQEKNNRYDIFLDRNISLLEYYYGGEIKVPFLDDTILDIKWEGFNNGKYQNMLVIQNKGLIIIPDNNYIVKEDMALVSNNKINEMNRGDLKVNLFLKIPIYREIMLEDNKAKIEELTITDSQK